MTIKINSWNVNGIRAASKKQPFKKWFNSCDADIINLQETRANVEDIPYHLYSINNYNSFFTNSKKKGFGGVATYTKEKPINVFHGLGDIEFDLEGRIIRSDFKDFTLLNIYLGANLYDKIELCNTLKKYVVYLKDAGKSIVICGDINIAHNPIDLKNPDTNHGTPGFTPAERQCLSELIDLGFVDAYRYIYPRKEEYTFWSYRNKAREKGIGWRLDYFFVSEDLKDTIVSSTIEGDVMGSDHCPITLELDL